MSLLYIGTFGSFIGFGFAFGQVLQVQFKADFATPVKAAYLTFLGPLLGSLIRPVGGALADRFGGAGSPSGTSSRMARRRDARAGRRRGSTRCRCSWSASSLLFVFSGIGNGSTYKMIPAIFRAKASRDGDGEAATARPGGSPARSSAWPARSARSAGCWSTSPSGSRS